MNSSSAFGACPGPFFDIPPVSGVSSVTLFLFPSDQTHAGLRMALRAVLHPHLQAQRQPVGGMLQIQHHYSYGYITFIGNYSGRW